MRNFTGTLMTKSQTPVLIQSNRSGIPGGMKDFFGNYNDWYQHRVCVFYIIGIWWSEVLGVGGRKWGENQQENARLSLIFRQYIEDFHPTLCMDQARPFRVKNLSFAFLYFLFPDLIRTMSPFLPDRHSWQLIQCVYKIWSCSYYNRWVRDSQVLKLMYNSEKRTSRY